jgi:hypothetical protein
MLWISVKPHAKREHTIDAFPPETNYETVLRLAAIA